MENCSRKDCQQPRDDASWLGKDSPTQPPSRPTARTSSVSPSRAAWVPGRTTTKPPTSPGRSTRTGTRSLAWPRSHSTASTAT